MGGVLVVMILGCVGLSSLIGFGAKQASDTITVNQAGKNTTAGQMGVPARDGKFEFTVTDLSCGHKTVGSAVLKAEAQGDFCIISLSVANIGKEAQSFDGVSQKAYDAEETQFSNDTSAELDVNDRTDTWFTQINPGNKITGKLGLRRPGRPRTDRDRAA